MSNSSPSRSRPSWTARTPRRCSTAPGASTRSRVVPSAIAWLPSAQNRQH
jgi:hypothetical protein